MDPSNTGKNSVEETRRLINLTRYYNHSDFPSLDEVYISIEGKQHCLKEGKIVSGRFPDNIRIDSNNYGAGQIHSHVFGRKGNEIGIVNIDGTASHGTKCRLHPDDASVLRANGFTIPADGLVEWVSLQIPDLRFLCD